MPPAGYRCETEVEIKRSRFITWLGRTDTEAEARQFIGEARAAYPDARHHCLAYVLDEEGSPTAKNSDDGEPAGTAGTPMLTSLMGADLTNVTAVVTRYFGGIKLGASGLTRAYGSCVAKAVAAMPRVAREVREVWRVDLPHRDAGRIQEELLRSGAEVVEVSYDGDGARLRFTCRRDPIGLVAQATQGTGRPVLDGAQVVEVPIALSHDPLRT